MAPSYLELARKELERLSAEIEPLQQALNRLTETREAWATIVRNAPVQASEPEPEPFPEVDYQPIHQPIKAIPAVTLAEDRNHAVPAHATADRIEETVDDQGWKINAVREMFRTTYPRF